MVMKFTNNATTTLASGITSVATSLTVSSGTGTLFPTLSAGDYFFCTLANSGGSIEIVKVTARTTDTFTVTRGQDGTTGLAWNAGDKVELRLVAASLNDLPKLDETNTFALAQTFNTPIAAGSGGTGVANNAASTITISGAYGITITVSGTTAITLPTTGTLSTLAGSETFTNKTLTNPTVTNYVESVVAIGNSGTAQTLSLTSGTVQTCTLTGNCTFTMPTATAGKSFILILSTGAGSFTATFTSVKWPNNTAPTITTTASRWDILTFVADGTNWYGNSAQAYA